MSDIRVTYSGFLFFITGIVTIFTSLIFMLIVTRSLTPQEFGTWNLINGLILYIALIQPVTSYWITREVARGEKSGKTAILSSSFFSSIGIIIFLISAFFVSQQTDVDRQILFFAALLIPISFLNNVLSSINLGFKPHVISLGQLFLEMSKIIMAIIFVYFLHLGVPGVILTITLATIPSTILLAYFAREKINNAIKQEFFKKWINLSWVSLYPGVNVLLRSLDIVIFSVMTGSVTGLAYFGAAWSVSTLVIHSGSISSAIYPKLLGGGKSNYLQDNITKILYFAILLSALSITFAKPGLFALNPIYATAALLVLILTMRFILDTINRVFESFITGIEKVDLNSESTLTNYAKSKLFVIPTFRLVQNGIYLVLLVVGFVLLIPNHSEFDLLIYWALLGFFGVIPTTVYLSILMSRSFKIKIDLKSMSKYLIVCISVFGPLFLLTEKYLKYNEKLIEFMPELLLFVGFGIGGYLLLTYAVDFKTRKLFQAVIGEIKNKIK